MPDCPHRPPCPGCPRFAAGGLDPTAWLTLAEVAREAGLPEPVVIEGPPFGWRHRARLAVRGRAASPKVGIFQEGSHRIADTPKCLVHHPLVNRVAAAVKDAVRAAGIAPYADEPHRGVLRYVQIVIERTSTSAQVVLVANGEAPSALAPMAERLRADLGSSLHSLWWNGNAMRTNTILGAHWHRWHGPEATREVIAGASVFFPPGAFGQANLPLADAMVMLAASWVPDGATVADLYAGCGPFGLAVAARARRVTFNEVVPASLDGLAMGIAALDAATRARVTVAAGPASDAITDACASDVVILDPPRKGLDVAVLDRLVATPPARVILVSCAVDAFAREARALLDAGRLRLTALAPFALVPHTAHVETVALFERASQT